MAARDSFGAAGAAAGYPLGLARPCAFMSNLALCCSCCSFLFCSLLASSRCFLSRLRLASYSRSMRAQSLSTFLARKARLSSGLSKCFGSLSSPDWMSLLWMFCTFLIRSTSLAHVGCVFSICLSLLMRRIYFLKYFLSLDRLIVLKLRLLWNSL